MSSSLKALFLLLFIPFCVSLNAQVMTFDTGASEPGFSFSNWVWDGADQVVYPSAPNVNTLMSITKSDGGCWTAISVNPSCWSGNCAPPGGGTWRVFSNKGHEAFFTIQTFPQVINLGWEKIKALYVQLDDPGTSINTNNTFNFDNVVYDLPTYTAAAIPNLDFSGTLCPGDDVFITCSGSLNDATHWEISTGGCGATPLDSLTSNGTFTVNPFQDEIYYVRGVDDCGCAIPGLCNEVFVDLLPDGCTDMEACNFDPDAICDDGSCDYPETLVILGVLNQTSGGFFFSCAGGETARLPLTWNCGPIYSLTVGGVETTITAQDINADPPYIEFITVPGLTNSLLQVSNYAGDSDFNNLVYIGAGCTDPASCNYNPAAVCDNGSCCPSASYTPASEPVLEYTAEPCGGNVELAVNGLLNDASDWALYTDACGGTLIETIPDNGSFFLSPTETVTVYIRGIDNCGCTAPGPCAQITLTVSEPACDDILACNYDPDATCTATEACEYDSCGCVGDLDNSGSIGTNDLLILLASFGTSCGPPFCPGDFNGDTLVQTSDLLTLLGAFGTPCP